MQRAKAVLAMIVVIFVVALVVFNASRPGESEPEVWNSALAKGDQETGKHFVMYTDIFCPYCDKFSNALHANKADFTEKYIDSGEVFYEMRVTDINYLSGHSENSRPAGEAIYCAAKQDKFWAYYEAILNKVFTDYHSKGIGVSKTAERIPELEMGYFYEAGEVAGVEKESFVSCMENHETLDELNTATRRAQRVVNGVPHFVFGKYVASGFDGNWNTDNDYRQAKLMLDAGLSD